MDELIYLRNAKAALAWKIFPEHRLAPAEFERRYRALEEQYLGSKDTD